MVPMQVLLQPGPGLVAAGQQELRGASCGAVNQPHRQLQDRCAGYRRSRGGQVSQTHPPPAPPARRNPIVQVWTTAAWSAKVQVIYLEKATKSHSVRRFLFFFFF